MANGYSCTELRIFNQPNRVAVERAIDTKLGEKGQMTMNTNPNLYKHLEINKGELAKAVHELLTGQLKEKMMKEPDMSLIDVEVTPINALQTQVRLITKGQPPRYFYVTLKESTS